MKGMSLWIAILHLLISLVDGQLRMQGLRGPALSGGDWPSGKGTSPDATSRVSSSNESRDGSRPAVGDVDPTGEIERRDGAYRGGEGKMADQSLEAFTLIDLQTPVATAPLVCVSPDGQWVTRGLGGLLGGLNMFG